MRVSKSNWKFCLIRPRLLGSATLRSFNSARDYESAFSQALASPAQFWTEQAEAMNVHWFQPPHRTLNNDNAPFTRWYEGATSNLCYNALDRHVIEGYGEQLALIFDSPVTHQQRRFTYRELLREVELLAHVMCDEMGARQGDVVMLYMPMVPEALVGMLACARLGLTHVVTFGGFAGPQLATRLDHAKPRILLTSSNGFAAQGKPIKYEEHIMEALSLAQHKLDQCLVLQREFPIPLAKMNFETKFHDWQTLIENVRNNAASSRLPACVSVGANDTVYILYTSGTTGEPKGIVRDLGGLMVSLLYSMKHVFASRAGEVFFAASDIGWVVGHSYIVYGPLLNRCTTVLYEGKPIGTPDAGALFRVISEYKAKTLFCAPTALRMVKKEDPDGLLMKKYDLSQLKSLFLAGERSDPATLTWIQTPLPYVRVVDNYWQTETGWPMVSNYVRESVRSDSREAESECLFAHKPGSAAKPLPGFAFVCVDDDGKPLPPNELGNLVVRLPLPPGCFPTLYRNPEKFVKSYMSNFPGYYETGDSGLIDQDGYVFVMTRTDDIINVNGVRLSTGAIEEVLLENKHLAECAVVGIDDALAGEIPVALVVVSNRASELNEENLFQGVRHKIGRFTHLHLARVSHLPKTRSGKILRNVIRNLGNGKPPNVPATIEDVSVVDDVKVCLERLREQEEKRKRGKE